MVEIGEKLIYILKRHFGLLIPHTRTNTSSNKFSILLISTWTNLNRICIPSCIGELSAWIGFYPADGRRYLRPRIRVTNDDGANGNQKNDVENDTGAEDGFEELAFGVGRRFGTWNSLHNVSFFRFLRHFNFLLFCHQKRHLRILLLLFPSMEVAPGEAEEEEGVKEG